MLPPKVIKVDTVIVRKYCDLKLFSAWEVISSNPVGDSTFFFLCCTLVGHHYSYIFLMHHQA